MSQRLVTRAIERLLNDDGLELDSHPIEFGRWPSSALSVSHLHPNKSTCSVKPTFEFGARSGPPSNMASTDGLAS